MAVPLAPAVACGLSACSAICPAAASQRSVQPDGATASVLFLYRGGRPAGATVKLSFKGSAQADGGSGPVRMRSVFQLLSTPAGWRIAAYQSRTGASG